MSESACTQTHSKLINGQKDTGTVTVTEAQAQAQRQKREQKHRGKSTGKDTEAQVQAQALAQAQTRYLLAGDAPGGPAVPHPVEQVNACSAAAGAALLLRLDDGAHVAGSHVAHQVVVRGAPILEVLGRIRVFLLAVEEPAQVPRFLLQGRQKKPK
jgi:hypothetical protein